MQGEAFHRLSKQPMLLGLFSYWDRKRAGKAMTRDQPDAWPLTVGAPDLTIMPRHSAPQFRLAEAATRLDFLFAGDSTGFAGWVRERASIQNHPFEVSAREADLEAVAEFAEALRR